MKELWSFSLRTALSYNQDWVIIILITATKNIVGRRIYGFQ
ncbi:hypothetical protein V1498_15245 [Peribacillus sp. SCS-26]